MKDMKRSVRRHHYGRIKRNWIDRLKHTWYWSPEDYTPEEIEERAARHTATPCVCSSCLGCINPRKNNEITLQERRNLLSFYDQLNEE